MTFYSASFLFFFLPLFLLGFYLIPHPIGKRIFLTAAGLVFYAASDVLHLPLLAASIVVHYLCGLYLLRVQKGKKAVLISVIVLDVAALCFFKSGTALPLGISFYTFQAISYVVDAYIDPEQGSANFFDVMQYLLFFPQLVCGPLQRFSDAGLFFRDPKPNADGVYDGVCRFVCGLAKKVLLAQCAAKAADALFAAGQFDAVGAVLAGGAYMLQIFFDFSAYSDMAVGIGLMVGYRLPENFRHPYAASSMTDFWRRWHISLSSWFRDYLYIPLGGSRKGKLRTALNKMLVFLATGLWHGFGWTYLIWGAWNGALVTAESFLMQKKEAPRSPLRHLYVLLCVLIGFFVFRTPSLHDLAQTVQSVGANPLLTHGTVTILQSTLGVFELSMLAVSVLLCIPFDREKLRSATPLPIRMLLLILLFAFCIIRIAAYHFSPFIYAQF